MKNLIHNLQDPNNVIGFLIILIAMAYCVIELYKITVSHIAFTKRVKAYREQMYIDMDQE